MTMRDPPPKPAYPRPGPGARSHSVSRPAAPPPARLPQPTRHAPLSRVPARGRPRPLFPMVPPAPRLHLKPDEPRYVGAVPRPEVARDRRAWRVRPEDGLPGARRAYARRVAAARGAARAAHASPGG